MTSYSNTARLCAFTDFRRTIFSRILLLAAGLALLFTCTTAAARSATAVPAPTTEPSIADNSSSPQIAVLAGGCFWGVQGVFQHVKGVTAAVSGYSGGTAQTAQYDTVSSGSTDHAESVQITFDPNQISYGKILQIFFSVTLDPTQLNRQGPDRGTQYRSEIFTTTAQQAKIARAYIDQLQAAKVYSAPIVTKVSALNGFYPAEDYHQDFLTRHPTHPYIVINDLPKVRNLKQVFPTLYRPEPVLAARS